MRRRLTRFSLVIAALAAILSLLEGGFDHWLASYCAAWALFGFYGMVSIDDDLARERFRPPEPGADRLPLRAIRIVAVAHLVVGALDAGRWHLTAVPSAVRAVALVAMAMGGVLII